MPKAKQQHYVVLLHGLARSAHSMSKLQQALVNAGYGTCNIAYPSTRYAIDALAQRHVAPEIKRCLPNNKVKLSFVTHSMGGIIVRWLAEHHVYPGMHRVVMLSPPNQGSEVVDNLGDSWLFQWLNGPAGGQLGTGDDSLPNRLGPAGFEVGIIAGNRSINWLLSSMIPGPDDGKVSIERAKLKGMADFLVVPATHPFIMRNDRVIRQTLYFLEHGRFKR